MNDAHISSIESTVVDPKVLQSCVDMNVNNAIPSDDELSHMMIKVPLPGREESEADEVDIEDGSGGCRHAPGNCSICLCTYQESDCVTWSSNRSCRHVFHEKCILDWLKISGKKGLKQRVRRHVEENDRDRQNGQPECVESPTYDEVVQEELKLVAWKCPICRQDFIRIPEQNNLLISSSNDRSKSGEVNNNATENPSTNFEEDIQTAAMVRSRSFVDYVMQRVNQTSA